LYAWAGKASALAHGKGPIGKTRLEMLLWPVVAREVQYEAEQQALQHWSLSTPYLIRVDGLQKGGKSQLSIHSQCVMVGHHVLRKI